MGNSRILDTAESMVRFRFLIGGFFALFMVGFLLLLGSHFVFINLIGKLDQRAENERSRMAIGKMIVSELQKLEIKYYGLATTTEQRFRVILFEEIEGHLTKVREALFVLERGGLVEEVIPLNLPESDSLIHDIEYEHICGNPARG